MCPASHDGFSVKGREGQQNVIQGGLSFLQASLQNLTSGGS
jgi:hypothetical protein